MELLEVGTRAGPATAEIVGRVRRGAETFELYFRFPLRYRDFLAPVPEAFLSALLVPAMHAGEPLTSRVPASPGLLRGFRRAQAALQAMYPGLLRTVPVEAPIRDQPPDWHREPRRLGSFFSCGVDSFFTVLSNLRDPKPGYPPLTHALFMRGLETELEKEQDVEASAAMAREAAAALGVELLEGESNLRSFSAVEWGPWNGTGLAGTAHALGRGFEVFLIPAGAGYWTINPPIGSHPLIDESCSTEWLRIHNDGAHVRRPHKIAARIGGSEVALAFLRICTVNQGGPYNCGRCPKCLRTMVALEAAGVLEKTRTLPTRLPPDWTTRYRPSNLSAVREAIAIARECERPRQFVRGLERVLHRARVRNAVREIFEATWLRRLLPTIRRIRRARASLRS